MNAKMLISRAISSTHRAKHFIKNFAFLPYYVVRDRVFMRRQMRAFVANVINLEKEYQGRIKRLDFVALQKMVGGSDPHLHLRFGAQYGNVSFEESFILAYLVDTLKPRQIFEIGTFDGFSTYHLAMNGAGDAKVFTLNLPVESSDEKHQLARGIDSEYFDDNKTHVELKRRGIGAIVRASPAAGKVTQLFGNSLEFDFSPYRGAIDFVFIDGGHSYECVAKDTESAFAMLSDNGLIAWHDFNVQHGDVYAYLMKLSETRKLYWVAGTRLALCGPALDKAA